MFYRICNLLTLNIELVFVFDGPNAPAKPGRHPTYTFSTKEARLQLTKDRALLRQLLDELGIPWIVAPGEAGAQCCSLELQGLVDAVWSQDSDCPMFGSKIWLRDKCIPRQSLYDNRNKAHAKKAAKEVRVVYSHDLQAKLRLKREGLVALALLVGGDYEPKGLPGCGAVNGLKVAKSGIGASLCKATTPQEYAVWRDRILPAFFRKENIDVPVSPASFPSFNTFRKYNHPN